MYSRYQKIRKIVNGTELYKEILNNKSASNLQHYSFDTFENLRVANLQSMPNVVHVVQPFEKLYMISQQYYNSPEYGWIILYTNNIPSELQIFPGTPLTIYLDLKILLGLL